MPANAMVRGWLEVSDVEATKIKEILEVEKSKADELTPDVIAALESWVLPETPESLFAFFGAAVHLSAIDYFRELITRIASEAYEEDDGDRYYAFGIFHINTDDGNAFRWRCRHGVFEELTNSEIECGMG